MCLQICLQRRLSTAQTTTAPRDMTGQAGTFVLICPATPLPTLPTLGGQTWSRWSHKACPPPPFIEGGGGGLGGRARWGGWATARCAGGGPRNRENVLSASSASQPPPSAPSTLPPASRPSAVRPSLAQPFVIQNATFVIPSSREGDTTRFQRLARSSGRCAHPGRFHITHLLVFLTSCFP